MLFDIHVHSNQSTCSNLDPQEIIQRAKDCGLDGVCITDHETMSVSGAISEGLQKNGLFVIIGMEYHTRQGDFLIFGPIEKIPLHMSARELMVWLDQHDGVAVAAHPCRASRPADVAVFNRSFNPQANQDANLSGCRLIEIFNGRNKALENQTAQKLAQVHELTGCAGSDAHTIFEIGKFATQVFMPVTCREEFVFALKNGLCCPATDFYLPIENTVLENGTSIH